MNVKDLNIKQRGSCFFSIEAWKNKKNSYDSGFQSDSYKKVVPYLQKILDNPEYTYVTIESVGKHCIIFTCERNKKGGWEMTFESDQEDGEGVAE